ncbi:MAG: hypothetical protein M3423_01855 [Actinomycetota bacterium]|nr:hypothetical protein [Actinomycetota bacterium]
MPSWTKSLAAVTALVALAGCGGSSGGGSGGGGGGGGGDQEGAVRGVMTDLQTASREGDSARICNQIFTPKLADSVTSSAKSGSCAKEVKAKVFSPKAEITVEDVTVSDAANAEATIKEQNGKTSNVFLIKQSGQWRIRSVKPA